MPHIVSYKNLKTEPIKMLMQKSIVFQIHICWKDEQPNQFELFSIACHQDEAAYLEQGHSSDMNVLLKIQTKSYPQLLSAPQQISHTSLLFFRLKALFVRCLCLLIPIPLYSHTQSYTNSRLERIMRLHLEKINWFPDVQVVLRRKTKVEVWLNSKSYHN